MDDKSLLAVRHSNAVLFPKLIVGPGMDEYAKDAMRLILMLIEMYPKSWIDLVASAKLTASGNQTALLELNQPIPIVFNDKCKPVLSINQRLKIVDGQVTKGLGQVLYPSGGFEEIEISAEMASSTAIALKSKNLFTRTTKTLWSPIVANFEIDQSWPRPVQLDYRKGCLQVKCVHAGSRVSIKLDISFSRPPQALKIEPNNLSQCISCSQNNSMIWQIDSHHSPIDYQLTFQDAEVVNIFGVYEISGNFKTLQANTPQSKPFIIKADKQSVDLARVSYATQIEETWTNRYLAAFGNPSLFG